MAHTKKSDKNLDVTPMSIFKLLKELNLNETKERIFEEVAKEHLKARMPKIVKEQALDE